MKKTNITLLMVLIILSSFVYAISAPSFISPTPSNNTYTITNETITIEHNGTDKTHFIWFGNTSSLNNSHLVISADDTEDEYGESLGVFPGFINLSFAFDENWTNYAENDTTSVISNIFINYTIPDNIPDTLPTWVIKTEETAGASAYFNARCQNLNTDDWILLGQIGDGGIIVSNYTLDSNCWNVSKEKVRLRLDGISTTGLLRFYEEQLWLPFNLSYRTNLTTKGIYYYKSGVHNLTDDSYANSSIRVLNFGFRHLNLTFIDEISNTLIEGETFSVYLERTGFSQTYTTTSNPFNITDLTNGIYELKVSSTNYPERQYFNIDLNDQVTTLLDIYLINDTDGSEITFNVKDSDSEDIEDVSVDFYRTIVGNLTLMAQEQTDFGGKCKLYLDTNYEYTINFTKTNYQPKLINLEPSSADSPYTIYLDNEDVITPPLVVSYRIRQIFRDGETYNLTYTNSTMAVHFEWYDENSYADNTCMKVYDLNSSFYSNCSTLNTGYMNYTIITDNRTYIAKAWVEKDNKKYTLKIININLLKALAELGRDVIIISWIVFLTLSFIGLNNPIAAIILGTFGLTGMYLIGMLPIGFGSIIGIISVAVIISIGIRRSRKI